MFDPIRFLFGRGIVLPGVFALAAMVGCAEARPPMGTDNSAPISHQAAGNRHVSGQFTGVKANVGTVSHAVVDGKQVLTLSDDFVVPQTPAPHWQVVDSQGKVYLLQRLVIKDDKYNKSITLPSYIHDVAKVQIWCAFAEVLLGEASFAAPVQ